MESVAENNRLERSSTSKRIAAYVRERIAAGSFEPGKRLNELTLSTELGVSRSPVREALAQLAGEGLVRLVPYKGTFVTALSESRLRDLLDFRLALEQYAVRRAMQRATPEDYDKFETLVERIDEHAKKRDLAAAVDADLATHAFLIELSGSELLAQTYRSMAGELRLYITQTSRHYKNVIDLATEHRALLAAMRSGKTDEATALIAAHIAHGFQHALEEIQ